jgi:hypothetical protein
LASGALPAGLRGASTAPREITAARCNAARLFRAVVSNKDVRNMSHERLATICQTCFDQQLHALRMTAEAVEDEGWHEKTGLFDHFPCSTPGCPTFGSSDLHRVSLVRPRVFGILTEKELIDWRSLIDSPDAGT